jgi:hypothetical protein
MVKQNKPFKYLPVIICPVPGWPLLPVPDCMYQEQQTRAANEYLGTERMVQSIYNDLSPETRALEIFELACVMCRFQNDFTCCRRVVAS